MRLPAKITVIELDEDIEPCGQRTVPSDERVVAASRQVPNATAYRIVTSSAFRHVTNIEIGWFAHEDDLEYENTNQSRHYLAIYLEVPVRDCPNRS